MATDFTTGLDFPRRGRDPLGGFLWLRRVFDKARAAANGTIHDYIYPCPMDKGAFSRWGITSDEFDEALLTHSTDDAILAWLESRVRDGGREAANRWLTEEKKANLDRQDAEEGAIAA
jgi:Domain of unknown function (DUF5069)